MSQVQRQRVEQHPVRVAPAGRRVEDPGLEPLGFPDRAPGAEAPVWIGTLHCIDQASHCARVVGLVLQQPGGRHQTSAELVAFVRSERVRIQAPLPHPFEPEIPEQTLAAQQPQHAITRLQALEALLERGQLMIRPCMPRGSLPVLMEGEEL